MSAEVGSSNIECDLLLCVVQHRFDAVTLHTVVCHCHPSHRDHFRYLRRQYHRNFDYGSLGHFGPIC